MQKYSGQVEGNSARYNLLVEQLKLLYNYSNNLYIANLVVSAIMAIALYKIADNQVLLTWFVAIWLCIIARFFFTQFIFKPEHIAQYPKQSLAYFFVVSLLFGCLWGSSGALFVSPLQPESTVFVIIILCGMLAGSLALAAHLLVFFAFAIPLMVPVAIQLYLQEGELYELLALVTFFALPSIGLYSRNLSKTINESIKLKYENIDLVKELTYKTEQAEQANLAKSKFLAAASHDLRQPLHAQGLFLIALKARLSDPELSELAHRIEKSTDTLRTLLDGLLDISKLDAGTLTPSLESFALQDVFESIAFEFSANASEKGLTLKIAPTSLHVTSDHSMLIRIMHNLVANAIRYTEAGSILIGARREGDSVWIEVWDTGIGIPNERIGEVFEEFYQLNNPERDRNKGLGLGLAIIRRLANLLKHKVEVRSEPNKGSVFRIQLPRSRKQSILKMQHHASVDDHLNNTRLHILENESDIRSGMELILHDWGCHVLSAANIEDAITQIDVHNPPDILITDYRISEEITGLQAIKTLQNLLNKPVPAVIITGDTDPELLKHVKKHGYPLLHKPVEPAILRNVLNRVLSESRKNKTAHIG